MTGDDVREGIRSHVILGSLEGFEFCSRNDGKPLDGLKRERQDLMGMGKMSSIVWPHRLSKTVPLLPLEAQLSRNLLVLIRPR